MGNPSAGHSRAIRVLYIHHCAMIGGASNSLRYLIESFPEGTIDACVLCPVGSAFDAFVSSGIQVVPIPGVAQFMSSSGAGLNAARWMTLPREILYLMTSRGPIDKVIREFRPDIVHLNERSMLHAAKFAKSRGLPVVMHARNVANRKPLWFYTFSITAINKYVDMMLAIDGSVKYSMRDVERCRIVYNPLRPAAPKHDVQLTSRRESSRTRSETRVTFLAALLPVKGVRDLLQAAKLLHDRTDIVFQIAGGNTRPREFYHSLTGKVTTCLRITIDLETEVKDFVREHHLERTVQVLGVVSDMETLWEQTDVLVFPSHLNGPSRSVFEAGVHGIPAVLALKDRVEDVVEDGVNGLIIPERDPGALASAIQRLADDDELRRQLGMRSLERYMRQFEPANSAQEVLAVYRAILSSTR